MIHLNTGVAWGWGSLIFGDTLQFFLAGWQFILIGLLIWAWQHFFKRYPVLIGLYAGAALSNAVDRIFFNGVRDWLAVPFINNWNNVADWVLITAALVFVVLLFLDEKNR